MPPDNIFVARDGSQLHVRPILAADVDAIQRMFGRLSPQEIHLRFQYGIRHLSARAARRLCELDTAQEAAFVLMDRNVEPNEIRGVGRIHADAATRSAEFAVLVERAWTGRGLGAFLMQRLIEECRQRELDELWGQVLVENRPMLDLCRQLGFARRRTPSEPGTALIALHLKND